MITTILNKLNVTRPLRAATRPLSIADLEEMLGQQPTTELAQLTVETRRDITRATTKKLALPSGWSHPEADSKQGRS